jgi:hypothetical protein
MLKFESHRSSIDVRWCDHGGEIPSRPENVHACAILFVCVLALW